METFENQLGGAGHQSRRFSLIFVRQQRLYRRNKSRNLLKHRRVCLVGDIFAGVDDDVALERLDHRKMRVRRHSLLEHREHRGAHQIVEDLAVASLI